MEEDLKDWRILKRHFPDPMPCKRQNMRKKISDEVFCLRVFTIIFAVKETLTDINATASVIDSFFKAIKERREFIAIEVLDGGKNRYAAYEEAFYTPHHNGPPWTIGKQFSEFCDCEMDLDIIMKGSIMFATTYEAVSKFFKAYKISCP